MYVKLVSELTFLFRKNSCLIDPQISNSFCLGVVNYACMGFMGKLLGFKLQYENHISIKVFNCQIMVEFYNVLSPYAVDGKGFIMHARCLMKCSGEVIS